MPTDNLEKIIKLSHPFQDEYHKGMVGVFLLETILFKDVEEHLKKYKLTYQQFNILRILKGQYPKCCSLSLLKERMLHKESDVSRLVDRLVNLGLVVKKENESNKRKIFICLSEEGQRLAASIDVNDDGFRSIMKTLSNTDILMFNKLVHKLLASQL